MIVHIFPKEKFTKINIDILSSGSFKDECIFFIINNSHSFEDLENLHTNNNVFIIKNLYDHRVLKYLVKKNVVIFHSLFVNKSDFFLLSLLRRHAKKWNWVIWGGDLHEGKNKISRVKYELKKILKNSFVNKLGFVTTLADKDFDVFVEKFNKFNGKHFKAVYGIPGIEILEEIKEEKENTEKFKILVGNNANPSNQHIESLEILAKFRKFQPQIVVPLSYGSNDSKYMDKVTQYGKKQFGGDITLLKQYMSSKEYYTLLRDINVAMFNTERQQALGNAYVLLFFGAKLYFNNNSGLIEKFTQEGAKVFSVEEIQGESYEKFTFISDEDKNMNQRVAAKFLDRQKILIYWEKIMGSMKELR